MLTDSLGEKTEVFSHSIDLSICQAWPVQNAPISVMDADFLPAVFGS
jgi:hypothetical protein